MLFVFLEFVNSVVVIIIHSLSAVINNVIPMFLWPKKPIQDEIALVTGGGSGIGREIALNLARSKCRVVLWDVNEKGNEETARMIQELGGKVSSYYCDVTNKEMVYKLAEEVKRDVGNVTLLVNNAGIVNGKKLLDIPDEKILATFSVNTLAHFWTLKAFLPSMMEVNKGHVVTVASVLAECGIPYCSDYCASKSAAKALHQAAAREMIIAGSDIKFTLVCPYLVTSGLFRGTATRFPWILPHLTPEYVGRKVVEAIQTNQEYLYLPHQIHAAVLLEHILPFKGQLVMEEFMGANVAMQTFTGREKEV